MNFKKDYRDTKSQYSSVFDIGDHSAYPTPNNDLIDETAEQQFMIVQNIIEKIRKFNIKSDIIVQCQSKKDFYLISDNKNIIDGLTKNNIIIEYKNDKYSSKEYRNIVLDGNFILTFKEEIKDLNMEVDNIKKEIAKHNNLLTESINKLNNSTFIAKARPEIIDREVTKKKSFEIKLINLEERLKLLLTE